MTSGTEHYDCLVIGAGPGGYTAAIRAAQPYELHEMKLYRDLCNSYKTYQADRIAYRDRAGHAVATALIELQRFLEAPDDVCRFTPVKEKRKNGTVYSPQGAVT